MNIQILNVHDFVIRMKFLCVYHGNTFKGATYLKFEKKLGLSIKH